jgi:ParB-like chromosome segregation protein Spo0J
MRAACSFAQPHTRPSDMSIHRPETVPPAVPATTTPQPRMRKPPLKVRAAIEALVTGQVRTITAAAKKVGLTRERLSRAFSEPHNAEALRTRAAREVALSSGRAAARLNQLIDSTSQRVALEATKFSLGVAGIKPPADAQVNVNLEIRAGYVLDLREYDKPAAKIVAGEAKVIGAKPAE